MGHLRFRRPLPDTRSQASKHDRVALHRYAACAPLPNELPQTGRYLFPHQGDACLFEHAIERPVLRLDEAFAVFKLVWKLCKLLEGHPRLAVVRDDFEDRKGVFENCAVASLIRLKIELAEIIEKAAHIFLL